MGIHPTTDSTDLLKDSSGCYKAVNGLFLGWLHVLIYAMNVTVWM